MDIVNKINQFRRRVFSLLTNDFSESSIQCRTVCINEINKVLICRPDKGLSNLLLISPLVQEIEAIMPHAKVDLIVKDNFAKILFQTFDNIDNIYYLPSKPFKQPVIFIKNLHAAVSREYDLIINAVDTSSLGHLLTKLSNGSEKVFGTPKMISYDNYKNIIHIAKRPIYALREYLNLNNPTSIPLPSVKLTKKEIQDGKIIVENINKHRKNGIIALFTYGTGKNMHSKKWWNELYFHLKSNFSDYNFIEILSLKNTSQINFKAPCYFGNNLREVASVINACDIFIGANSGIMHLASCLNINTYGLFNCTDIDIYRPYSYKNHAINTSRKNIKDIIKIISNDVHGKNYNEFWLK